MRAVSAAHLPLSERERSEVRDFRSPRHEFRRLFGELLGTYLLVLVAVGAGAVDQASGGMVGEGGKVVAPALMVTAIILSMGTVSGAHLNPAITLAFALRRDFPWRRVPGYVLAQGLASVAASLTVQALFGLDGALVGGDLSTFWIYLVGPTAGALLAVAASMLLRGKGGGPVAARAAQGDDPEQGR
jgi:glycerol uptake facilitator-like aquaporin